MIIIMSINKTKLLIKIEIIKDLDRIILNLEKWKYNF